MCMVLEDWVREESIWAMNPALLGASYTRVLGRDPLRYAIIWPPCNNGFIYAAFGEHTPIGVGFGWPVGGVVDPFTRRDIGDIICEPIWMLQTAGAPNVVIWTISYNVERKRIYDAVAKQHISKLLSS
jgi:hypothetical protein